MGTRLKADNGYVVFVANTKNRDFDLASSGSKEQIEVVTQRPWMRRNIFDQIKIGAFWSLPDSRFSAMCKEGQL
ncbi:hypothetical protein GQ457_13G018920 [Hibiscus cannabinus]